MPLPLRNTDSKKRMTDQEIVQGLLERNNRITRRFFYVKARPLLLAVIRLVFPYQVDYDEVVAELYAYLMEDDAAKLRQFRFRSSLYQWLKVVATRFFIRRRDNVIENTSRDVLYEQGRPEKGTDSLGDLSDRMDVERMLAMMENRRYADAIRNLVLRDADPAAYAAAIGVSVANLYNIKTRAMAAFTRIALKYYSYGK